MWDLEKTTGLGHIKWVGARERMEERRPAGGPRGERSRTSMMGGDDENPRANKKKEEKTGLGRLFSEEENSKIKHLVCVIFFFSYHITKIIRLLE